MSSPVSSPTWVACSLSGFLPGVVLGGKRGCASMLAGLCNRDTAFWWQLSSSGSQDGRPLLKGASCMCCVCCVLCVRVSLCVEGGGGGYVCDSLSAAAQC